MTLSHTIFANIIREYYKFGRAKGVKKAVACDRASPPERRRSNEAAAGRANMAATRAGGTQEQGDGLTAAAATTKRVAKGRDVGTQNGKKRKSALALVILLRFFFGYVKPEVRGRSGLARGSATRI